MRCGLAHPLRDEDVLQIVPKTITQQVRGCAESALLPCCAPANHWSLFWNKLDEFVYWPTSQTYLVASFLRVEYWPTDARSPEERKERRRTASMYSAVYSSRFFRWNVRVGHRSYSTALDCSLDCCYSSDKNGARCCQRRPLVMFPEP